MSERRGKMNVSELEGAELDYWVARANGQTDFGHEVACWEERNLPGGDGWSGFVCPRCGTAADKYYQTPFCVTRYSSDWAVGGPIIERERIMIYPDGDEWDAYHRPVWGYDGPESDVCIDAAPTPLIAAMRCYIASKFGETVPDHASPAP